MMQLRGDLLVELPAAPRIAQRARILQRIARRLRTDAVLARQ
jgi:hypothetical protein